MSVKDTPNLDAWKIVLRCTSKLDRMRDKSDDLIGIMAGLQTALVMTFGSACGMDSEGNVCDCDPALADAVKPTAKEVAHKLHEQFLANGQYDRRVS